MACNIDNQKDVCYMLNSASRINVLDQAIAEILKPYGIFSVHLNAHSTGIQCQIKMSKDDYPTIVVWNGSVWYGANYEFNDRGKTLGYNPEAVFAHGIIRGFFRRANELIAEKTTADEREKTRKQEEENRRRETATDFYRNALQQVLESPPKDPKYPPLPL